MAVFLTSIISCPTELILLIAKCLPNADLAVLSRTCHLLHTLLAHALDLRFVASAPGVLLWAARKNSPVPLQRALSLRTPVPQSLGVYGYPLLYESARDGLTDTVRVLLAHGASPNIRSFDSTPLLIVVHRGHVGVARMILEAGADVDRSFEYHPRRVAVMLARCGRVINREMVNLLLQFGAGDEGIHGPGEVASNPRLRPIRGDASGLLALPHPALRSVTAEGPSDVRVPLRHPAGLSAPR